MQQQQVGIELDGARSPLTCSREHWRIISLAGHSGKRRFLGVARVIHQILDALLPPPIRQRVTCISDILVEGDRFSFAVLVVAARREIFGVPRQSSFWFGGS